MRVNKYLYLFVLQGKYGHGWEDLSAYDSWKDASQGRREYRDNEGGAYRIIYRRELNPELEEKQLPDLSRTAAALDAFDEADARFTPEAVHSMTTAESLAAMKELDVLAAKVGRCYGLDTADRNSLTDCADLVRPNSRHSAGESFVRRMVEQWRNQ